MIKQSIRYINPGLFYFMRYEKMYRKLMEEYRRQLNECGEELRKNQTDHDEIRNLPINDKIEKFRENWGRSKEIIKKGNETVSKIHEKSEA